LAIKTPPGKGESISWRPGHQRLNATPKFFVSGGEQRIIAWEKDNFGKRFFKVQRKWREDLIQKGKRGPKERHKKLQGMIAAAGSGGFGSRASETGAGKNQRKCLLEEGLKVPSVKGERLRNELIELGGDLALQGLDQKRKGEGKKLEKVPANRGGGAQKRYDERGKGFSEELHSEVDRRATNCGLVLPSQRGRKDQYVFSRRGRTKHKERL